VTSADLPVPHWSIRGEWEPIYEPTGERREWPAGFDPARLPRPRHQLRERVAFAWRGRRLLGEIRDIRLAGGRQAPPEYIIYTSGHGYWVPEEQVE
jgi:hypothetical protein